MNNKQLIFLIILILTFGGCNSLRKSFFNKKEDFSEFNNKFHSNTDYQLSRVDFPIKGFFVEGEEEKSWTKENWKFHKTPVGETKEGMYQVDLTKKEELVIEKIWIENSEFYVERRFKRIDGKWYLVYFKDIN